MTPQDVIRTALRHEAFAGRSAKTYFVTYTALVQHADYTDTGEAPNGRKRVSGRVVANAEWLAAECQVGVSTAEAHLRWLVSRNLIVLLSEKNPKLRLSREYLVVALASSESLGLAEKRRAEREQRAVERNALAAKRGTGQHDVRDDRGRFAARHVAPSFNPRLTEWSTPDATERSTPVGARDNQSEFFQSEYNQSERKNGHDRFADHALMLTSDRLVVAFQAIGLHVSHGCAVGAGRVLEDALESVVDDQWLRDLAWQVHDDHDDTARSIDRLIPEVICERIGIDARQYWLIAGANVEGFGS